MMVIFSYILVVLFIKEYYLFYFILLGLFGYAQIKLHRGYICAALVILLPFLLFVFDEFVYEAMWRMDIERFYMPISTFIGYTLSFIHGFILFFSKIYYNKLKKVL